MAVTYEKYRIPFRDINEKPYQIKIFETADTFPNPLPTPIVLTAGDNPLVIDEDDSKEFYAPIRTQTGNLTVCTKIEPQEAMLNGGILDLADIAPSNNTNRPIEVQELYYPVTPGEEPFFISIWLGYLSCESYNQAYTDIPENIQLPINSVLEAWKSIYYGGNAKVLSVNSLLNELLAATPGHFAYLPSSFYKPLDASDFFDSLINTSIFIKKTDYHNEESTVYKVEGSSFYEILEAICKFAGLTAREWKTGMYLQKAQGYGLLANTETREMSALSWRGTGHQRNIVSGAKSVKVTANLESMDINTGIPEIPYGSFAYEVYQQIGSSVMSNRPWVYILPSADEIAYNNLTFHHYAGEILLGFDYAYSFQRIAAQVSIVSVVSTSIPVANTGSNAYEAYNDWSNPTQIHAGAFLCRLEEDQTEKATHDDAKDGIYVSLFPGAWVEHTEYTEPIFEMRSVQAFAAFEDGYLNLDAKLKTFFDSLIVGARDNQCRLMMDLRVGDYVWTGITWLPKTQHVEHFFPQYNQAGDKFLKNWSASMDIDEVDGICIPTFFMEDGVKKHIMGEVVLQIYPETRFFNKIDYSDAWRELVFGIFFEQLNLKYYPKKSAKRTDRSSNTYFNSLGTAFADEKSINTDLASWLNNNPSPSLLYSADGSAPLQTLSYKKADSTTEQRRPETDLLNRMAEYYSKPRTILNLEVQHIDDKPLPLLRYNGLGDGKVYAPMSASRDFQMDKFTINFMEIPQ